jgi:hypothetical protein
MTAVYFLKAIEAGWIKIGYSKRDRSIALPVPIRSVRTSSGSSRRLRESGTSSERGTDG